jgi:hypothetical protein
VVNTGNWLAERLVLIVPGALQGQTLRGPVVGVSRSHSFISPARRVDGAPNFGDTGRRLAPLGAAAEEPGKLVVQTWCFPGFRLSRKPLPAPTSSWRGSKIFSGVEQAGKSGQGWVYFAEQRWVIFG